MGLVNPGDLTVGTAAKTLQFSLKSTDICTPMTIAVTAGGNYTMAAPPYWDSTISICKATPGTVLANGVQFSNSDGAGPLADTSRNSDLDFDVKYNKGGTNPQGKVMVTLDSNRNSLGTIDGKIHTYIIRSNAISTFSVSITNTSKTANFSSKANVQELVCDAYGNNCSLVSLDGGAIFQVYVKDGGANGSGDMVSVTVNKSSKQGGLWFSSKWDGSKTVAKAISAGDISVS